MLYAMMRASGQKAHFPPREISALKSINEQGNFVTKRPLDVFEIDLIKAENIHEKEMKIVLTIRDPRSILVSRHATYPHQYFIGFDQSFFVQPDWLSFTNPGLIDCIRTTRAVQDRSDLNVMAVRFENLIFDPEKQRCALADFTGLPFDLPFNEFYSSELSERLKLPLNGVRPIDPTRLAPWKHGVDAARIVRQFRLAPELFDAVESWGYESDRNWFEELAKAAPEGLDDTLGLIVGYFTEDNYYRSEARRLEASVKRLHLPLQLISVANQGGWLANVRFKPQFLRDARRRYRGPLFYLDVDAVLHRDPWPYLNGLNCDVAFCAFRDGKARSGTIYLADTPGAVRFLEDWARRIAMKPEAWDQHPLDDIAREQRATQNPAYSVQFLPPSLCWVFDREHQVSDFTSKVVPIVEHLQASRERKGDGPLLESRCQRIAILESYFQNNYRQLPMPEPLSDFALRCLEVRSQLDGEPRRLAIYDQTIARIDAAAVHNFQDKHRTRLSCYKPAAMEKFGDLPWYIADKTRIAVLLDLDRKPSQVVLDIGSGAGHFLSICNALGHRALGVDIEEPFYDELCAILRVERRIVPVARRQRLPHLGHRFDLITIIAQMFDLLAKHPDGSRDYWSVADWVCFHNDLVGNHLAPGGTIYIKLNKEWQHDTAVFNPDLLQWYKSIGAAVREDEGAIIIKPKAASL